MPQQDVTQPDPQTVPPYDGRTTGRQDDEVSRALTGTVDRQLDETKTGRPGATASPAEESPVGADELAEGDPATPLGVGTSTTRRGEDVVGEDGQQGRYTTGTQGQSQRPVGSSTSRDSTGIDPQDPEGGPAMPASGSST